MFGSRKQKTVHKGRLCLPPPPPRKLQERERFKKNVKPLLLKAKPIYSPEPQRAGTQEREVGDGEKSPEQRRQAVSIEASEQGIQMSYQMEG